MVMSWRAHASCLFQLISIATGRGFANKQPSSPNPHLAGTRRELLASLPAIYPHDLRDEIRRDSEAVGRMLVVLDDDPTGTQTVHSVPVLAEWSVENLAKEVQTTVTLFLRFYKVMAPATVVPV